MSGRMISLAVGIVLASVVASQGAFETVGVFDPDDAPHHNQVDQDAVYDGHSGNAGPANVMSLAAFQQTIGRAFEENAGGVINGEGANDALEADGESILAQFGVNKTKSVTFTNTSGNMSFGSGGGSGNRLPISGDHRFGKSDTSDFVFQIGEIAGGEEGEVIACFVAVLIERDNRETTPVVTATFTDGSTVTATADMIGDDESPNSKDTFVGFVAPSGEGIVSVEFDLNQYIHLDELAFVTSAFQLNPDKAANPSPSDGAIDILRDGVVLSWTPGETANQHDVYLGMDFDDVNEATTTDTAYLGRQTTSAYSLDRLSFSQTYYWRIDEVTGGTVSRGQVWQFTVEPVAATLSAERIQAIASSASSADQGPENTINGSGLDAADLHSDDIKTMWITDASAEGAAWIEYQFDRTVRLHEMIVWNHNTALESGLGFGIKEALIEYSADGEAWTPLGTTHTFAKAPGAPGYAANTTVDFHDVAAQYVRITANSNWGGAVNQKGLSEVRFMVVPVTTGQPRPAPGATGVDPDVVLNWRSGREAAVHELYLGSDVNDLMMLDSVTESRYDTAALGLQLDETYYWRVDEVNEATTPTIWEGDIWSFSTLTVLVVDDFESYMDDIDAAQTIWQTWIDGLEDPQKGGSQVGYGEAPFAEQTIIHGGTQSMPFTYDNTAATHSEASRTFDGPQDWTRAGVKTLVLHFFGDSSNTGGQPYVKINGTKVPFQGDPAALNRPWWTQWNIDLAATGANLRNVREFSIGVDGAGAAGIFYVDDIVLYKLAPAAPQEQVWIEAEAAAPLGEAWTIGDDPAASGGKYLGSQDGDGNDNSAAPGPEWIAGYRFDVAGGTYKVMLRGQEAGSDSFWVRILGATSQTHEDPDQAGTGWVTFNGLDAPDGWNWDEVHSDDHNREIVHWTLPAGTHTLEIAKREDGVWVDAIVITDVTD